jgi:hypothetical protein
MSTNDEMQPENGLYTVQIQKFAERHFIKNFKKKYNTAWGITYRAIESMLGRVDSVLMNRKNRAEAILTNGPHKIMKMDFSVAGTNQSPKGSGNRIIAWVNEESKICSLLLVYSKNDIPPPNETQKWKKIVKENYPELKKIFPL